MERKEFREKLRDEITSNLRDQFEQYIKERFENYFQLLRYLSALDRKYSSDQVIQKGFPGIFKTIDDTLSTNKVESLWKRYGSAIEKIGSTFPDEVRWKQGKERFIIDDQDGWHIRLGKTGKQLLRRPSQYLLKKIGATNNSFYNWHQTIPLSNAVTYYLVDTNIVTDCIHLLERTQLLLINEIEQLLVSRGEQAGELDLEGFVASQESKLEKHQQELLKKVGGMLETTAQNIISDVEKVGTFEKGSRSFSDNRLYAAKDKLMENREVTDRWHQVQQLFLERTKDVADFLNLWSDIEEEAQSFGTKFDNIINDTITSPLGALKKDLEELSQKVDNNKLSEKELEKVNKSLTKFIDKQLVEGLRKLLEKQILSDKVEHLFEDLLLRVGQSSEKAQLVFDMQLEKNPPEVSHKEVQWRQIVIRALREQLLNPLRPSEQQYEQFLAEVLEEIIEIENIITVNFDSAIDVRDEELEESEDQEGVVTEALQRILAKVEELNTKVDEKRNLIDKNILEGGDNFYSFLLALLHKGDSQQMQILNAKYRVKEKTGNWRTVLDSKWARLQDQLMLWSRFVWKKLKKYGNKTQSLIGLNEVQIRETQRADIATYLSETDKKMRELPYIYRRLFDFQSLADKRFFELPQESSMIFKKAFEQWQQGMHANFVVMGEKGSGKSSFLNVMIESRVENNSVEVIEFDQTIWNEEQLVQKFSNVVEGDGFDSVDALIEAIHTSETRKVIALESLQNCFVRNIDGFKAIEKLTYLIAETRGQIFWITSCSRYAWMFLNKTVQLGEYFSHIGKSDALDANQIQNVILNRHQASGYSLYFEPDDQMLQSRTFRKLRDDEQKAQEHLKEEYFEQLTKLAEGNPSIAIIFWIRSIRDFDETTFYIQPLEVTSVEMIENLNPQVLFALAAFVLHDTLIDQQLAMVLNITTEESKLLINRLQSRGMLVKKGTVYTINHLMYRQIVRVLKEHNIIHLV